MVSRYSSCHCTIATHPSLLLASFGQSLEKCPSSLHVKYAVGEERGLLRQSLGKGPVFPQEKQLKLPPIRDVLLAVLGMDLASASAFEVLSLSFVLSLTGLAAVCHYPIFRLRLDAYRFCKQSFHCLQIVPSQGRLDFVPQPIIQL